MKKLILFFFVVFLLFTAGCSQSAIPTPTTDPTSSTGTVATSKPTTKPATKPTTKPTTPTTKPTTPATKPTTGVVNANTIGAERGEAIVTLQDNWLYHANRTKIVATKTDGSSPRTVYTVNAGRIGSINALGEWLYFAVENSSKANSYIARVRIDGTGFEKLLNGVIAPEMLVIKNTIYFTSLTNPYKDFAKDACPLYSMPLTGGMPKMLHDGYVFSLTADSNYLYFVQNPESGTGSIYRMKYNGNKAKLVTGERFGFIVLQNSRLYFLIDNDNSREYTVASISVNGGSITRHGNIPGYSDWFVVIGQKVYFSGMLLDDDNPPQGGVIEFNLSSKTLRLLQADEDYDISYGFAVGKRLFMVYGFSSYNVYDPSTQVWKTITV